MTTKKGTACNDTISGTNDFDQLFGDLGNDALNGLRGDDALYGGEGNDRLDGGLDDDLIYGGFGRDTILGGDGDDVLNHTWGLSVFGSDRDKDVINGGNGNDLIIAGIGDSAIGGAGNDLLQLIVNESAVVKLDFSKIGGNAVAVGARGTSFSTTFVGSVERVSVDVQNADAGSSIVGSSGDDRLSVYFEELGSRGGSILGGDGNDTITGSNNNDTIVGGAGHDRIDGGSSGQDTLAGGPGDDIFLFKLEFLDPPGEDRIDGFTVGHDIIAIQAFSFEGNVPFGNQSNLLLKTANPVNGTTAAGTAQMIYETDTGKLFLDSNGRTSGGLDLMATLSNKANISASDILIEYFLLS